MPTAIEYASPGTPVATGMVRGWIAAAIAVISCAVILLLAFKLRVQIDTSLGWCGTAKSNLQSELANLTLLWILPVVGLIAVHRAHVGLRICRTAILIAMLGWIICEFWI
jgi:hypothetical protein